MTEEQVLLAEEKEGVMTLTLNRPQAMNSLNFSMLHSLRDQVEALRFRSDIRVVIITGSGDKAFCS
ncbi:MAG: enoyl-CoA hydratase/isomerase family protein, partial [Proteobacteria bacterium]|nr:enoyl-CoA hydratase/isomerase family protein [Pseudomonadota bacterium]